MGCESVWEVMVQEEVCAGHTGDSVVLSTELLRALTASALSPSPVQEYPTSMEVAGIKKSLFCFTSALAYLTNHLLISQFLWSLIVWHIHFSWNNPLLKWLLMIHGQATEKI